MTRKMFDWHPELNLFASKVRGRVEIRLSDGEGGHMPPPEDKVGFIDSDDVAYYYFNSKKDPLTDDICIKAPWPVTWIEYVFPRFDVPTEIESFINALLPGDLHIGAYLMIHEIDEENHSRALAGDLGVSLVALADQSIPEDSAIPMWQEMSRYNGRDMTMRALSQKYECHTIQAFQIYLADRKRWDILGYMVFYLDELGCPIKGAEAEIVGPSEAHIATFLVKPFLMTLGLLNCKNVETKCVPTQGAQAKKLKRFGSPIITRRTLVIHPKGKQYDSLGPTGTGGKKRWHMCRGHFKTFTDAAPLFGRVTGTYWWGAQVRGSKSRGEVHKDYRIEPE